MKKKDILIVLSIMILLINIINSWFNDYVLDRFWIIWLLGVNIPLFIIFLVLLIFSIKIYKNNITDKMAKLPLIILTVNFAMVLVFVLFNPLRILKVKYELNAYEKDRYEVIELVKNNKLELDTWIGKNAYLPKKYQKISTSGEVFVFKNDEEGVIIGFWVFRGMLNSGSIMVAYSSETEEFTRNNIEYLDTIKKLKEHWYYVTID